MKSIAFILVALLAGAASGQDDVEAKKKRLGEILKQMSQLQMEAEKLLKDLSGGDPRKYEALMLEVAEMHAPEMAVEMKRGQTAANERNASASLKTVATAETDFRSNDRDENRVNDFWVGDVSGLYRCKASYGPIKLIDPAIADADAAPLKMKELADPAVDKPRPKAGYLFVVIRKYEEGGKVHSYDSGNRRAKSVFGFAAYPAEYPKTGKHTFIICEGCTVFRKDTGGKPPEVFPEDPSKTGWQPLD